MLSFHSVPSAVSRSTVTQAAVSGKPALTVSWSRPQSDLVIIRYDVQYRVTGTGYSAWKTVRVTGPNPFPTTLSPLVGGTRYDVRVRAVSAVGDGVYSSITTQTASRGIYIIYLLSGHVTNKIVMDFCNNPSTCNMKKWPSVRNRPKLYVFLRILNSKVPVAYSWYILDKSHTCLLSLL